ncbi:MAG: hypothetical protein ACRD3G_10845 [Vicinamibacterales bacterium]
MRKTFQPAASRSRVHGMVWRTTVASLGLTIIAAGTTACQSAVPTAPGTAPLAAAPSILGGPTLSHFGHQASGGTTSAALSATAQQEIAQLRAFMAPLHNPAHAAAAGYDVAAPAPGVCISDPARGGMGYHYTSSKKNLILDGVVNLLEPEFIVFSPERNGGVRLSAADYFVPYSTWTSADPPSLLGIPFHREDAFQAYVLHIWAFWPNPAGIFANFNPDVPQCP